MKRIFSTFCLVVIFVVILLEVGDALTTSWKCDRIYSSLHLVGAFWIGAGATLLYTRRSLWYDEEKKE